MSNKTETKKRQQHIADFITKNRSATQADILKHLVMKDCPCSQATVARDLKKLNLKKIGGLYNKTKKKRTSENKYMLKLLAYDGFKVVTSSKELPKIVIQAERGTEHAIADILHKIYVDDIVGVLVGYGCVIIIPTTSETFKDIEKSLSSFPNVIF